MLSTLNLKLADPHDQDVHDHEVVEIAPAAEESCPAPDATRPSLSTSLRTAPDFTASDFAVERLVPRMDTEFRPAANDAVHIERQDVDEFEEQPSIRIQDQWSLGRSVKRAVTGLLIMVGGAAATVGWQAYGNDVKYAAEKWPSQVPLISWLHLKKQETAGASSQPAVLAAATTEALQADAPASEQPAAAQQPSSPPPQAATGTTAPAASPLAPELTQSIQSMTRDIATLQKGIEQLKANQEQTSRDVAKLTEQEARRRAPPPPPRASISAHRPATPLPPPQAAVQPRPAPPPPALAQSPVQLQQPQSPSVPRPPAPVPVP